MTESVVSVFTTWPYNHGYMGDIIQLEDIYHIYQRQMKLTGGYFEMYIPYKYIQQAYKKHSTYSSSFELKKCVLFKDFVIRYHLADLSVEMLNFIN